MLDVLPEKWKIKITKSNTSILYPYWKSLNPKQLSNREEYEFKGYLLSNSYDRTFLSWCDNLEFDEGGTTLVLEEFQKLVLNNSNQTTYEIY